MDSGYHILGGAFEAVESGVESFGRRISPWLWIFTLAGFGLSVWSAFGKDGSDHPWRPWT